MAKKLGRNEPCWCGSGLKYKKCHLDRDRGGRPSWEEVGRLARDLTDKKYCLHPEAGQTACSGQIVKAHTIQRSGGLSRIARDGHVTGFKLDVMNFKKHDGSLRPEPIGLKLASTFTGFCSYHDSEAFRPIETTPLEASQEHSFLVGYRPVCRELYAKRAHMDSFAGLRTLDRGLTELQQRHMQAEIDLKEIMAKAGLDDMEHHKSIYDAVLSSGDYSTVNHLFVWLDSTPDVMFSGAFSPPTDFNGEIIQSPEDFMDLSSRLDQIAASLIATDSGGAAVLTWIGESEVNARFVRSLSGLPEDEIPHALVRFGFASFENLFTSPDWWDGLETGDQEALLARYNSGPNVGDEPNSLRDDGRRLVSWRVVGIDSTLG
jgi:hypothetical protein